MSVYVGHLGRMIELKCPSTQSLGLEDRVSFGTTLGGRKVGQVQPGIPKRVWQNQLSDASTPDQIGAVMAFINGEWGIGPFVFVSADAPVTNMLSPAVASCDPKAGLAATNAADGPMSIPGGWAGRSIRNSNPSLDLWFGLEDTPVIPGVQVTASAYVLGAGAAVRVYWLDATGASLGSATSTVVATAGAAVRSWITADPPAGSASCRVRAINATQGSRPALTWSDALLQWADGQGCPKAIIHGASRNLIMASRDPRGGRYSNLSFTATEVG